MVSVKFPPGVELAVVTVIVEEPEPLTEGGVKVAAAPTGSPLTLSATLSLKPLRAVTVAV